MSTSNFQAKLLKKLEQEKIKPTPKRIFITFNVFKIIGIILLSIIWWILISIVLGSFVDIDTFLLNKVWPLNMMFMVLPFFWIFILFLSTFLFYWFFRKIARWYRYSFWFILGLNMILYSILWLLFFHYDIHENVEQKLIKYTNIYNWELIRTHEKRMVWIWQNENMWLLAWYIVKVNNEYITLLDYNNKKWYIYLTDKTKFRKDLFLRHNFRLKIEWEKISEHRFKAYRIMPFRSDIRYSK